MAWHVALFGLVFGPLPLQLSRRGWLRALLGLAILVGLAYHVVVVIGCHRNPLVCA